MTRIPSRKRKLKRDWIICGKDYGSIPQQPSVGRSVVKAGSGLRAGSLLRVREKFDVLASFAGSLHQNFPRNGARMSLFFQARRGGDWAQLELT